MNKIQDGFYAGGDSYKPLAISTDMRHRALLSFVQGEVIIRPAPGVALTDLVTENGELRFKIQNAEAVAAENAEAVSS